MPLVPEIRERPSTLFPEREREAVTDIIKGWVGFV
jgi:hypothetical protein